MKKKLLFVTYGGGHVHMVYPVVQALHKSREYLNGEIETHVLGMPSAKAALKQNHIDCISFADYLDKDEDADALAWGRELAKEHHSPTIGVELEDSIAYLGLCYKDLVVRLGEEQAEKLFKQKARHAFHPLTILERVFDDIKPDFVVASNSPRSEAAAIETANNRGIGSLIMTDLFTGWGGYKLQAGHITFLNEFARERFEGNGLVNGKTSRFYYTGNPAFDKILRYPKEKNHEWMRAHFPQAEGKPVILHADMHAYWNPEKKCSHIKNETEMLQELDACYKAAMLNKAAYLVRPHPSQDRKLYHRWLEGKEDAWLAADCDLHDLLRNIDLLLARTTTVSLEAAYMQKRVLQLDCDFHTDLPLAEMGIAWGVNGYGELPGEIKSALTDDKKFEEIRNRLKQVLPAEPAAEKIAGIILENIKTQP